MKLIKVSDGLLEVENFYLTSSFPDFLGNGSIHRDNDTFYIDDNINIERNFNYITFVIELHKINWNNISISDNFVFYINTNNNIYGIEDNYTEGQSEYQKIICSDKYIQTYISNDRVIWNNVGGIRLDDTELIKNQGFKKKSDQSLVIKDYKVYNNPYVTLQNMQTNYKAELYDVDNNLLKTRLFDENMECKIFLDYCLEGYFKIYDDIGNLVYTTNNIQLQYGDIYCFTSYDLELYYNNRNITNENTTFLPSEQDELDSNIKYERIILKNVSNNDTYNNLRISIYSFFDDIVQLSLDNENFADTIIINNLQPSNEVNIYIKITKGITNGNFTCRHFKLLINKVIVKNLILTLCQFNIENKTIFDSDEYIIFDGISYLKTSYNVPIDYEQNLQEGIVYSSSIDKNNIKQYVEFMDNGNDIQYTAIPKDRLLIQQEDYDLSNVIHINSFNLIATGENIKIVFSVNEGLGWQYFNGSQFQYLSELTVDDVKQFGNTIVEFNNIKNNWDKILVSSKEIRFAYLLSMDDINEVENLDNLELDYDAEA